jgi:hypothetical protein
MAKIKPPEPSLLFIGILYVDHEILLHSKKSIESDFGPVLFESPSLPWDYSSYYKEELGSPIFRQFVFFNNLIDPGSLADIKLTTMERENELILEGKRRVNLDPGYLMLSRIVLASAKNYAHRIYLGKGIYGDVTLLYSEKEGTFKPHLFTYRDYQEKSCIDMFLNARKMRKGMSG